MQFVTPVPFQIRANRRISSGIAIIPAPVLVPPLTATLTDGTTTVFKLSGRSSSTSVIAVLADSPLAGTASALNIAGATVTLQLRMLGVSAPVFSKVGRIVQAPNVVACDFGTLDVATLLANGWGLYVL